MHYDNNTNVTLYGQHASVCAPYANDKHLTLWLTGDVMLDPALGIKAGCETLTPISITL
jgi:hypothetical protein